MAAEDYMVSCLNKKIFGIECFGCGAQRAMLMVWEGRFTEAFQLFPAVYSLIVFGITVALHFLDKKRNYASALVVLAILNSVIMVVSYFMRNDFLFK